MSTYNPSVAARQLPLHRGAFGYAIHVERRRCEKIESCRTNVANATDTGCRACPADRKWRTVLILKGGSAAHVEGWRSQSLRHSVPPPFHKGGFWCAHHVGGRSNGKIQCRRKKVQNATHVEGRGIDAIQQCRTKVPNGTHVGGRSNKNIQLHRKKVANATQKPAQRRAMPVEQVM